MPPLPPVTKALMLICTAIFFVQSLLPMLPLTQLFALWPLGSGLFWPWQVLSYSFLHGDVMHLFFNMLGLWMFGSELERLWGQKRYLQLLGASGVAHFAHLGGMLGAWLMLSWWRGKLPFGGPRRRR